jgi:hypothetical protein
MERGREQPEDQPVAHQPPDSVDLRRHPPRDAVCAHVRGLLRDYADGENPCVTWLGRPRRYMTAPSEADSGFTATVRGGVFTYKVDDAGLNRHVERRYRFVEHQELGVE